MTVLLLYLPVIHAGYERLLDSQAPGTRVLVLGESFAAHHKVIAKEIRALAPARAAAYVAAVHGELRVEVVEVDGAGTDAGGLVDAVRGAPLAVPDESLLRDVVAAHALDAAAEVTWVRTFLRWDREWSRASRPAGYDGRVSATALDVALGARALAVGEASSDWWRQVGAVLVRDGEVLDTAYNVHRPTEYSPYVDGDPRNEFRRGVRPELGTALHAEGALIARAARDGRAVAGADLYVSTFPCPSCARLIAEAGLARCLFAGGYSQLDGERILRAAGVELVFVDLNEAGPDGS